MTSIDDLPYRPCVGVMLLNAQGDVFVGRRADRMGAPEGFGNWWQMPQGGVDEGEDLYEAALRELHEETNISSVERIGEIKDWLIYDIPRSLVGQAWKGKYRGQKQKWYAFRFTGKDSEIDIAHPAGGKHKPEFVEWRFEVLKKVPDLVVPFKREVYERVVKEFAPLTKPLGR